MTITKGTNSTTTGKKKIFTIIKKDTMAIMFVIKEKRKDFVLPTPELY